MVSKFDRETAIGRYLRSFRRFSGAALFIDPQLGELSFIRVGPVAQRLMLYNASRELDSISATAQQGRAARAYRNFGSLESDSAAEISSPY